MPVKSIDRFQISFLAECVADDDDIAPAEMHIAREHHHTVADAVNRIAQIAVAAADAVPIFAEMTVGPVAACLVIALRVRFSDGKIETIGEPRVGHVRPIAQSHRLRRSGDNAAGEDSEEGDGFAHGTVCFRRLSSVVQVANAAGQAGAPTRTTGSGKRSRSSSSR